MSHKKQNDAALLHSCYLDYVYRTLCETLHITPYVVVEGPMRTDPAMSYYMPLELADRINMTMLRYYRDYYASESLTQVEYNKHVYRIYQVTLPQVVNLLMGQLNGHFKYGHLEAYTDMLQLCLCSGNPEMGVGVDRDACVAARIVLEEIEKMMPFDQWAAEDQKERQ